MNIYDFSLKRLYEINDYELKNRIKVCRAEKNMTQADLGTLVNTTRQAIALIEAGKHAPSLPLAIKITNAFGKKLEEIFYFERGLDYE